MQGKPYLRKGELFLGRPVDPLLPVIEIDFQFPHSDCTGLKACGDYLQKSAYPHLIDSYVAEDKPFDGQIAVAWLDLRNLSYDTFLANVKKQYKGSTVRSASQADKQGFICKPFAHRLFIPDIVAINHSKEIRSGGPMTESYRRTIDEMGGAPTHFIDLNLPKCPVHYGIHWGIFSPEQGYKQGDVVTNERLLAYINLRRIGNAAFYSQILGHGDYLKFGIMYRLHFAIVQWLLNEENEYARGLEHLEYSSFYGGTEGLQMWKKKALFKPAYFVTCKQNPFV